MRTGAHQGTRNGRALLLADPDTAEDRHDRSCPHHR